MFMFPLQNLAHKELRAFLVEDQGPFILHNEYPGNWWLSDISSHDIGLISREHSSFNTISPFY